MLEKSQGIVYNRIKNAKGEAIMKFNYGLQMYSVRDITKSDLKGAIKKVAELGYKYLEFAGFFDNSAEDVKAWMDECGVSCSGTHSPWLDLKPDKILETVKYHKTIGNPHYIIPGADLSTLEKIEEFVNVMNFAQPILAAEGITLGYHNHSGEFKVMPWGSTIHSELEKRTNILFEIDTYWAFNAGIDPIATMERLKDRIKVIHLKDGYADGRGMALGEGEAPVKAIREKAIEIGLTMVVESETLSPDGISEVGRCINYLRSLEA